MAILHDNNLVAVHHVPAARQYSYTDSIEEYIMDIAVDKQKILALCHSSLHILETQTGSILASIQLHYSTTFSDLYLHDGKVVLAAKDTILVLHFDKQYHRKIKILIKGKKIIEVTASELFNYARDHLQTLTIGCKLVQHNPVCRIFKIERGPTETYPMTGIIPCTNRKATSTSAVRLKSKVSGNILFAPYH